ncbi:MAG: ABC transporter permease [Vicinamibacteria bacterium]
MKRSLRSRLWRVPVEQEVDEEIALHLELRARELMARGADPETARRQAQERMGDVSSVKRELRELGRKRDRDMKITTWLEELRHDVVFSFRQLRKAPAFTAVAVATLALGIGANSAIFALVDATLLRPLPFADPGRLVAIHETSGDARDYVSPLNLRDWSARSASLDGAAGFTPGVGGMVMAGPDGSAESVSRQWVSAELFDVLGVKAVAGRTFLPSDDEQRANVVVMSEPYWRARFGADPRVVDSQLRLDGALYTVVGVVPQDFRLVGRSDLWGMRPIRGAPERARAAHVWSVVGRLKPGVTVAAAQAELGTVAAGLAREFPQTNTGRGVALEPLRDAYVGGDVELTSLLFLGVVGVVLLTCCVNVANLLLARASARSGELAVRAALGASRGRIVRQLLTESVVLSTLGGTLGIALGAAIVSVAPALIPEGLLPPTVALAFDLRVVAWCAGAALLVGVLFGLAPAWQATSVSSSQVMRSDSRTTTGAGGRLRGLLVTGEVAAAVLLLFGAGLLLRTLAAVGAFDRGYRAESVLSMLVDPLGSKYPTPEALQQFYDEVEREVRAAPGVADLAWTSALPLGVFEDGGITYEIVGDPPVDPARRPAGEYQVVSASYFPTLDLPVVSGRGFDRTDTRDGVPVAMVNEAFVKALGGRSPIGLQVSLRSAAEPDAKPEVRTVVGVARQVKGRPDEARDFVQVYVPLAQNLSDDVYLVVRPKSGEAAALAPAVRAAIGRVDRERLVGVREVVTLADIERTATSRHRFRAVMVASFAALALLLAMVGVFGILAYSVEQRMRDLGVRRALGATTNDLVRLVVASAARVVGTGVLLGLALAAVSGRVIATFLFGVRPLDLATFAGVTALLALAAAASVAGPALRAARVDPASALRVK